jgi:hypothetical protein
MFVNKADLLTMETGIHGEICFLSEVGIDGIIVAKLGPGHDYIYTVTTVVHVATNVRLTTQNSTFTFTVSVSLLASSLTPQILGMSPQVLPRSGQALPSACQ